MTTVYQCIKLDRRYAPARRVVAHEAATQREAIEWLEHHGGGIYRNALHRFQYDVASKEMSRQAQSAQAKLIRSTKTGAFEIPECATHTR